MPKPNKGESKDDFISRCIPVVMEDGTAGDNKQAYAVCNNIWEKSMPKSKEAKSIEQVLSEINNAFYSQFSGDDNDYQLWIVETHPNHLIIHSDMKFYKLGFTKDDSGAFSFDSQSDWVEVENQFVPVRESAVVRLLESAGDKTGASWDIVVIGPDKPSDIIEQNGEIYIRSKNGYVYSAFALRESVGLWEGTKVYDNHLTDAQFVDTGGLRSANQEWLGNIVDVYWHEESYSIRGTFKVVDEGLRKKLLFAEQEQVLDTIGLSIDAWVATEPTAIQGNTIDVVTHITQATSVDLVSEPAAGGRIIRALAGNKNKELIMPEKNFTDEQYEELKDLIGDSVSSAIASLPDQITSAVEAAMVDAKDDEIETDEDTDEDTPEPETVEVEIPQEITEALKKLDEGRLALEQAQKVAQCGIKLSESLSDSGLPAQFQTLIRNQFENRAFKDQELEDAIKAQREALMPLVETGQVRLPEGSKIQVLPITEPDRYELAFMRLVMGSTTFEELMSKDGADYHNVPAVKRYLESGRPALPRVTRLSEFYAQYTEDYDWVGVMRNQRILEAAGTTSSLTSIVKNTVNLMLAADYAKRHQWWNSVVRNEDVDTLDEATLVRFHGLDTLSVVPEGQAYTELSLSDEEETAVYVKKGDFIGITLETFLQDKLGLLRRLPNKLSIAWYNTISKLVSNVFTIASGAGPTLADTGALFNATALTTAGGHANLLTTGFSHAAFSAVRTAMRKQTDQPLGAGERLNILPKVVLCPADLETTVEILEMSQLVPEQTSGTSTNEQSANTFKGKFTHEVVPHWTDANDWAAVADPSEFPAIWLIWLRGRRSPEVYTADAENAGAMFTHDTIRLKSRMFTFRKSASEDCAPVGDWRPLHKSNVS